MWRENEKSDLLMDVFCVSSFCCLHDSDRVQWVLCLFSVLHSMTLHPCLHSCFLLMWWERKKSDLLMDVFCVSSFFCLYHIDWVEWVLCLISVIHSTTLLLCLQSCSLLKRSETKRVDCWCMSFVCLLSFVFTTQIEFSECRVWFQWLTQWFCFCVSNSVAFWFNTHIGNTYTCVTTKVVIAFYD